MNKNLLVSVVIPTYNYADFISEAIDSVFGSDFFTGKNIEIIVVDDGSTDNTKEKVETYGDRITYIYQENLGKAEATKVAIEHSQGKYIFNLDADDFFLPNKIRKVVSIFESDPEIFHVAHPAKYCLEGEEEYVENIPSSVLNKKILGNELLSYFYRKGILFGGGSTFAVRADILRNFKIPRNVDMYIDEYLVIAANCQGGYSYFLDDPLSIWRIHGRNFSAGKIETDQAKSKERAYRNLASVEAILVELDQLKVTKDIKRIYRLKTAGMSLSIKEKFKTKTLIDILRFCSLLVKECSFLGFISLDVIRNHKLLHRVLPSSVILYLKRQLLQSKNI